MKKYSFVLSAVLILFVHCLLCSLAGCTKAVDIDEPADRQLVLNGEPQAGRRAFVYLGNTRFFLDADNDQPVDGASLTLYVNGVPYLPDSVSHCRYFFPYTLQPGDSLEVFANVPDGRAAHARTYVPLMPQADAFGATFVKGTVFNYFAVGFNLSDYAATDEIYSIAVQVRDSGARYNEWTASYDTVDTLRYTYFCLPGAPDITADDVCPYIPMVGEPFMLYGSRVMFLDKHIAGRQNMPVEVMIPYLRDTSEVEPFRHEYVISVSSITPARFRYIISASSQGSMTSFFAEQGQAYGNVDGALGVFAGSATKKFRFDQDSLLSD